MCECVWCVQQDPATSPKEEHSLLLTDIGLYVSSMALVVKGFLLDIPVVPDLILHLKPF